MAPRAADIVAPVHAHRKYVAWSNHMKSEANTLRLEEEAAAGERGGVGQNVGDLIGARDPETRDLVLWQAGDLLPAEPDLSARGWNPSSDDVEERALAGSIRPDYRV